MSMIAVEFTDPQGTVLRIDDAATGQSLMELARGSGIEGILAECGGACSCATCHVYIAPEFYAATGEPDDVEEDMLDMVDDIRRPTSRLSCQIRLTGALDGLRVEVAPEL